MDREKIKAEIKDIITIFIEDIIDENAELQDEDILIGEEYGIDSVCLIQIIVEIERRFNIEIEDEYLTMDFLSSINAITDFVVYILENTP